LTCEGFAALQILSTGFDLRACLLLRLSFTGHADPHHADQSVAAVYFDGGEFFDISFELCLFRGGVAETKAEGSDAGDGVGFEVGLALQAEEVGEFFIEEHRAAAA